MDFDLSKLAEQGDKSLPHYDELVVAASQASRENTARRQRQGSQHVYVDDLSYEPLPLLDPFLVVFTDEE